MSSFQKGLIFGSLVVCLTVLCSVSVPAQSSDLKGQKGQDGKTSQTLEKKSESKEKTEVGEKSSPKSSESKKSVSKPEKNKKPKEVLDPDKTDRFYTFKDEKGIEWIKQPYKYMDERSFEYGDRHYILGRFFLDLNGDGIGELFITCPPEGGTGGNAMYCFMKGQKGYVEILNFQGGIVSLAGKKNAFLILKTSSWAGGGERSLTTWTWNGSKYMDTESIMIYAERDGYTDEKGNWILKKGEQKPIYTWEFTENAWEDKQVWKLQSEYK